jgi:hypothetical protein
MLAACLTRSSDEIFGRLAADMLVVCYHALSWPNAPSNLQTTLPAHHQATTLAPFVACLLIRTLSWLHE